MADDEALALTLTLQAALMMQNSGKRRPIYDDQSDKKQESARRRDTDKLDNVALNDGLNIDV